MRDLGKPAFVAAAVVATLLSAASAQAARPPAGAAGAPKPFFDSREGARVAAARTSGTIAAARPSAATRSQRDALRDALGTEGILELDPLTGTPRQLVRTDGALASAAGGSRSATALGYVRAHDVALGLSDADVDGLEATGRFTSGHGLTVVRLRQLYRGIPAFDNELRVGIDSAGRVLSVVGSPRHDLSVPSIEPSLSGADALAALQRDVGVVRAVAVAAGPVGARQQTTFADGDVARLVLFGSADGARLAWSVTYRATSTALYDAVVDAQTGAVLYRQNLTKADGTASVYPYHPGASAPITVNLHDYGLKPGATVLDGTWVRAWSDLNDDDQINAGEDITPSSGTNFTFGFLAFAGTSACTATRPCSWSPTAPASWQNNRRQNGVQAFYLASRFHDHLANDAIGFTDASGNFEVGGTGGDDPVKLNADDGAATGSDGGPDADHVDNANMATPPDGQSPTMQMYLFADTGSPLGGDFRSINGGDDAGILWHEYTHGLSGRLVTNADGSAAVSSPQAGAMGEAWSDWYALDYLVSLGLKTDNLGTPGEVDLGDYSDADPHALRTQPADCPVAVVDSRCPGGSGTAAGGYTYGDFGQIVPGGPEVHGDGEIWLETLWDLRQQLLVKLGNDADASAAAESIVTDGMRLSPPEPSMLEMRNAILVAEQADFGGEFHSLVWDVFSHRGMGFYAAASDGSDIHPVEDFQGPPDPGGPKGTITGTVTDAGSGLPLAGVDVAVGGHATNPDASLSHALTAVTGADGHYAISDVPEGLYPKLAFQGSSGFLPVVTQNVAVSQAAPAVRDVALQRNWAALSGGAAVTSVSDDTGAPFGCGVDEALDSSQGTTWSAFNPTSVDPGNPHAGPPTAVVELPRTIDVTAFEIDPSGGCGDDPSASTREFTLETSTDATTWRLAVDGRGALGFTDADTGRLNTRVPAAATGSQVRFVRITLLSPLHAGAACAPDGCSGTDFIDLTELRIDGAPPNVLPAGTLVADPAAAKVGGTVRFDASSFSDPDSRVTGYDWDFDGDGTIDRSTDGPTTTFAYAAAGTYGAKVFVKDFRGGSGSATQAVVVGPADALPVVPPGPPPPPPAPVARRLARPTLTLPSHGSAGSAVIGVRCAARCAMLARFTLTTASARALGLRSHKGGMTTRAFKTHTTHRVRLRLSTTVRRAARRHGVTRVKVVVRATAHYTAVKGTRTARRTISIRL